MNLIIVGASGFVGRHLTHYFQENGIANTIPLSLRQNVPKELQSAEALIHLAGKAHDLKTTDESHEYFEVNYSMAKKIFDLFLQSRIKDFIYFSSVKAVADSVEGVLREDQKPNPITPYGQSKLQAEQYLLSKALPEGKRLIILRPCMIHGPGNKGNLNLLYKFVSMGIPYPLGAFDNKRSFLSIDNLLFILDHILNTPEFPSGVYNVADDRAVSTKELIKLIAKAEAKKEKIWNLRPELIKLIAKIGDKTKLSLNSERLQKLTEDYVVGNEKILDAMNLKELPYSAEDGLLKTLRSFLTTVK